MRSLTAGEIAALEAANKWVSYLAEIQNGDGTFIDLTSLSGLNFCEGASFSGGDVDQPIANATIRLRRDSGNLSLAPFMEGSTLNRLDDGMTYAPLLDAGRRIRLSMAVTAHGVEPVAGDFQLLFDGFTDGVEFGSSTVNVFCRDLGSLLVDTQIDTLRTYGSDAGVAIETVMQAILDDNLGASAPTLFVPTSPLFLISPAFEQQRESVWDALTALIQLIGWRLSYEWDDGTSSFRLTFVEPDRSATIPDWTFSPSEYVDISHLSIDRDDVRTRVRVTFIDSATGEESFVEVTNPETFARYGDRLLHIIEGSDSPIDTVSEATDLADSVLADVSNPIADQEVETIFFWPAQVGDLLRFAPNGVHYDVAQDYAVASIRHELSINSHRTFLRVQGKPSGGFLTWLQRARQLGPGDDIDVIPEVFSVQALFSTDALTEVQVAVDDDVRADGVNPSGYVTIGINVEPADPTDLANDGTFIVPAGTRAGSVRTNIEVDSDDVAYIKAVAVSDAGVPGPVAGPFKFVSPGLQPWTKVYTGVTDAVAVPLLTRDGLPLDSSTVPEGIRIDVDALNLTSGERNTINYSNVGGLLFIGVIKEVVEGPNTPEFFLPPSIRIEAGGATSDVQVRIHPTRNADPPRTRISVGETRYNAPILGTSGNFLDGGGAVLNVRHPDFGAVGDGLTDDTAAFAAARDAAIFAGGGVVTAPAGVYRVKNLLFGEGAETVEGFHPTVLLQGSGPDNTVFRGTSDIGPEDFVLHFQCPSLGGSGGAAPSSGVFADFTVDGQGRSIEHHGILIEGGHMRFRDVNVRNVNGHGIRLGDTLTVRECFFNAIHVRGCGRHMGAGGSTNNAAILFDLSDDGTELNNLHWQGLQIVFPWYAGIHMLADVGRATRQIWFSQLMLHGQEGGMVQQGRLHSDAAMVWLNGPVLNTYFDQTFITRVGSDDELTGLGPPNTGFRFDAGPAPVGPDNIVLDKVTASTSDRGRLVFIDEARDIFLQNIEIANISSDYPAGQLEVTPGGVGSVHVRDCNLSPARTSVAYTDGPLVEDGIVQVPIVVPADPEPAAAQVPIVMTADAAPTDVRLFRQLWSPNGSERYRIESMTYSPDQAITGSAVDYAEIVLLNQEAGLATEIGRVETTTTIGALAKRDFVVTTPDALTIASDQFIRMQVNKVGAGVTLPAGLISITLARYIDYDIRQLWSPNPSNRYFIHSMTYSPDETITGDLTNYYELVLFRDEPGIGTEIGRVETTTSITALTKVDFTLTNAGALQIADDRFVRLNINQVGSPVGLPSGLVNIVLGPLVSTAA